MLNGGERVGGKDISVVRSRPCLKSFMILNASRDEERTTKFQVLELENRGLTRTWSLGVGKQSEVKDRLSSLKVDTI